MWIIASIPFWLLGAFALLCAYSAIPQRRPNETSEQIALQIVVSLFAAGILFVIAAKVAS